MRNCRVGRRSLVAIFVGVCLGGSLPGEALGDGGRKFEMVSPIFKGGFGATHIEDVAEDGESTAFFSPGEFAGAPAGLTNNANGLDYISRRSVDGWTTTPVMPPDQVAPFVNAHDINPSLSLTLALAKPGTNLEAVSLVGYEDEFLLHDTRLPDVSENWILAGMMLKTLTNRPLTLEYEGASEDFCHILFVNSEDGSAEPYQLLTEAIGATRPLYEVDRGCNGEQPQRRLVAVGAKGKPISTACGSEAGLFRFEAFLASSYNAISKDGNEVFFTTCIKNEVFDHQLFMRVSASKTVEISRPVDANLEACGENQIPCPGAATRPSANFAGASGDGSRVFFTTAAKLVSSDADGGGDLYLAHIGCPASEEKCLPAARRVTDLVQVSKTASGEGGVLGVMKIAPDGSRVYFVATSDLLSEAERLSMEAEGREVPRGGAENLYVYDDRTGQVSFIVDLCSKYQRSGAVSDMACASETGSDTKLWSELSGHEVQTGGSDGRFLIFSSYGRLTSDDTDANRDVYRYDAETKGLIRVSGGEGGYDANGNGAFDAEITASNRGGSVQWQNELGDRTVSEDGSRIIFTTAEPLAPSAINGLTNVYEWHEDPRGGAVSLVSGGTGETSIEDAVVAPSGRDVFFATTEGLVAADTDGEADIYDARLGGGFPEGVAPREPCSSDACQGPLTNPAPLLVPASMTQTAGEGFATPHKASPKPKRKKHAKRHKRRGRKRSKRSSLTKSAGRRRGRS
jgi:hypothetical protein